MLHVGEHCIGKEHCMLELSMGKVHVRALHVIALHGKREYNSYIV